MTRNILIAFVISLTSMVSLADDSTLKAVEPVFDASYKIKSVECSEGTVNPGAVESDKLISRVDHGFFMREAIVRGGYFYAIGSKILVGTFPVGAHDKHCSSGNDDTEIIVVYEKIEENKK